MDISKLAARPLTEEEIAERTRRSKEIRAGRHPDTGKRLSPGDRRSLKAGDLCEFQNWIDTKLMRHGPLYLNPFDRGMIEWQERQRHDLVNTSYVDRLCRSASDIATGTLAASSRLDEIDALERNRGVLDPLLDSNLINRITGGVNAELMRKAIEDRDLGARQTVLFQVDQAATKLITGHWQGVIEHHSLADRRGVAFAFAQNTNLMAVEAQRMLSIYGPALAEQNYFLGEYRSNLTLFQDRPLDGWTFEGADLLARVALPMHLLAGLEGYGEDRVESFKIYAEAQLAELEEDFAIDQNPVFAFQAFSIARSADIDLPDWALDHIDDVVAQILGLDETDETQPNLTEAERVGKAAGFGTRGRGKTGRFAAAKLIQRDREIFSRVEESLASQHAKWPGHDPKLTSAYNDTATEFKVDASTVGRVYRRMKDYVGGDHESD